MTLVLSSIFGAVAGARISEWVEREHGQQASTLLAFVCLGAVCIFWARAK